MKNLDCDFIICTTEGDKLTIWSRIKGSIPFELLEYFAKTTHPEIFRIARVSDGKTFPLLTLLEHTRKKGAKEGTLIN